MNGKIRSYVTGEVRAHVFKYSEVFNFAYVFAMRLVKYLNVSNDLFIID